MQPLRAVARFLRSTRLTIALCLVLAAGGIAGSLLYQGNTAFEERLGTFNVFRSPLFLVPAGLLVLSILVCAGSRLASMSPRNPRTFTFAGIHLGLVLLAAGLAADGVYGFVGTNYFFVGVPRSEYYNWRTNRDETLPFAVEVLEANTLYHPVNLRIGLKDAQGAKIGVFTVREGVPFRAGNPPITVTPRRFDVRTSSLHFDAEVGGQTASSVAQGSAGSPPIGGYVVVPVAFGTPEPSDHTALVRFSLPGREPESHEIRINRPAVVDGKSFCITSVGQDRYLNPYVGLQITREPGSPLFWAGSILFSLSLLGHLYGMPRREAAVSAAAEPAGSVSGDLPGEETIPEGRAGLAALFLAAACVLLPAPANAAGGIGRAIFDEETWRGEVRVVEPVTVEKGATLRILAGTTVLLSGEDRDGDGCRDGYIQALGRLVVSGEKDRPVVFRRLDPEKAWEEVFLLDAEGRIRHAVFEGARWGLHVHDGDVAVENAVFRGNGGGARLKGSGTSFSRCTFRGNGIALRFRDGGPSVVSSILEGNGTGVFYREGAGGGRITGSILSNREWNVKVGDWATGDLDLSGNYWGPGGGDGSARLVRDFRERKAKGRILLLPALSAPPGEIGAEEGEDR